MANEKITAPRKISLDNFLSEHPELRAGRVELLGAFKHFMEQVKKVTVDTEANFAQYLQEFKTKGV